MKLFVRYGPSAALITDLLNRICWPSLAAFLRQPLQIQLRQRIVDGHNLWSPRLLRQPDLLLCAPFQIFKIVLRHRLSHLDHPFCSVIRG